MGALGRHEYYKLEVRMPPLGRCCFDNGGSNEPLATNLLKGKGGEVRTHYNNLHELLKQ